MPPRYPPGPANGLLGLHHMRRLQTDLLGFVNEVADRHGDVAAYRVGPVWTYQLTHPDHVQEVLVRQARKFVKPARFKYVLGKWDGQGLVTSDGELWVRQRRLVQQAFHPHRVRELVGSMVERVAARLDAWERLHALDLTAEMNRITLDIVVGTLFGLETLDRADAIGAAVADLQAAAMHELTSAVIWPDWCPLPYKRRMWRAIGLLRGIVEELIARRRATGVAGRRDVLSLLLAAVDEEGDGRGMSDQQARDEVMTLFLAGHETTAVSLVWACWLLARYPEAQQQAADEVRQVLAGREATADDLPRLNYVERCHAEAMRLFPPVYLTTREVAEEVEVGGYRLARGSLVQLVPYRTHRDARWFDAPLEYRPDRFLPEAVAARPPLAYFPFGAGPRVCIGRGFATTEAVLVLAGMLARWRIEPAAGQGEPELETQVSLHPRGPVRVQLTPRT